MDENQTQRGFLAGFDWWFFYASNSDFGTPRLHQTIG
jgi:hypothetical protein